MRIISKILGYFIDKQKINKNCIHQQIPVIIKYNLRG